MKLANKVALITGAGSGMGRTGALLFAAEGARVAAVDIDERAAAQTARDIESAGGKAVALGADVSKKEDAQAMVAATIEKLGVPDIVYNNAGIEGESAFMAQLGEGAFDRVIAVNLRGTWLFLRAVAPGMVARGRGAIVNLASIAAFTYTVATGAYGASKAGVVALTRDAAFELAAHGVRVNAIAPGNIANPRRSNRWPPSAGVPLGSGGPEDIAGAVRFLVTDASRYVIGQTITVAGGGDLSVSAGWG